MAMEAKAQEPPQQVLV